MEHCIHCNQLDGDIHREGCPIIDSNQSWFWTEEWQEGERRVDKNIAEGNVQSFDTMEEFLCTLKEPPPMAQE